jgi:U3 small nucleolar ribonucleoprotein component
MSEDDDVPERAPLTIQSLSSAQLFELLQHQEDEELAEMIEAELERRTKEGGI